MPLWWMHSIHHLGSCCPRKTALHSTVSIPTASVNVLSLPGNQWPHSKDRSALLVDALQHVINHAAQTAAHHPSCRAGSG